MPANPARTIPTDLLTAVGPGAPSLEDKQRLVADLRRGSPATARLLDRFFVEQIALLRTGQVEASRNLDELVETLNQLTAAPLVPAIFLGPTECGGGPAAEVVTANARRIVPVTADVPLDTLRRGDEVLLNQDLSILVTRASATAPAWGETATYERHLTDGTMLVRCRDEQIVLGLAAAADDETWKAGDLVRWDRGARLAMGRIDAPETNRFILEQVPDIGPDAVGGQDANLRLLTNGLMLAMMHPDQRRRYGLPPQANALLEGPPGVGKTLMSKVALAQVQRTLGTECRLCVIKPGEWEGPYVGETQRHIRETFAVAGSTDGIGVIFIDEIEAIGRHRGGLVSHHADKFLAALLAEMQGFETEGRNIVVIAATNRLDLLDSALAERFEIKLAVGRPDRRAARTIFGIHLPEDLPCSEAGDGGPCTRAALIERAVGRFYSHNADNEICTIRFRDNKERVVSARELASGRCFRQVCIAAAQVAAFRACEGADPGVRLEDIDEAVDDAFARMASTLSRQNVHHYLHDLPQDVDIVAVEPVSRRVRHPHHYLSVA